MIGFLGLVNDDDRLVLTACCSAQRLLDVNYHFLAICDAIVTDCSGSLYSMEILCQTRRYIGNSIRIY